MVLPGMCSIEVLIHTIPLHESAVLLRQMHVTPLAPSASADANLHGSAVNVAQYDCGATN